MHEPTQVKVTQRMTRDPREIDAILSAALLEFGLKIHRDRADRSPGSRSHLVVRRTKDGEWKTSRGTVVALRLVSIDGGPEHPTAFLW